MIPSPRSLFRPAALERFLGSIDPDAPFTTLILPRPWLRLAALGLFSLALLWSALARFPVRVQAEGLVQWTSEDHDLVAVAWQSPAGTSVAPGQRAWISPLDDPHPRMGQVMQVRRSVTSEELLVCIAVAEAPGTPRLGVQPGDRVTIWIGTENRAAWRFCRR